MAISKLCILSVAALIATIMTVITAQSYSRQGLLDLRPAKSQLPPDVYDTVCNLGICSRKPTRRGCRGGKNCLQSDTIPSQSQLINTSSNEECSAPTQNSTKSNVNQTQAKLCVLNTRSVRNKSTELVELVVDNKYDLVAITET